MSKYNLLSLAFVIGGIVLAIFQAVQSMMTVGEIVWEGQTLFSLYEEHLDWIDTISISFVQGAVEKIVHAELFVLMIAIGLIMIVAGMVFKK